MRLVDYMTNAGCRKKQTVGCFQTVGKAFDSVCYDRLLFKLQEIQLPGCYIHMVSTFLTVMAFCVRLNDHVPSERRIPSGIPQGRVLVALLFPFYVKNVPREPGAQTALFADDTMVYTAVQNDERAIGRLQHALDAFAPKRSAVLFSKHRKELRG